MSNFFTNDSNNESAIAPWNASLEPIKAIIPQLDANPVLTGGVGQEVNIPTLTPEAYDNIILPDASLTRMASAVSTDSNSSLPDSSVDLLTGQAMSEVYGDLSKFAADPDLAAKLNVPFGENWDAGAAKTLAEAWFQGDFSDIPQVKVVSSAEIDGANGAFAAATDTIYLSKELLAGGDLGAIADVLREEIGHSVDVRLNGTDSPGDEGAIFGAIVQGKELSEGELQGLKSKDDTANIVLGGEDTTIEMNQQQWRVWRYADWRGKNSDFWLKPDGSSDQNGNRPDGKDGININWGQGSPFDTQNISLDLDNFATSGATQANFEAGKTYKFRVSADDGLIMAATQIGKSNFNFITPLSQDRKQVEWQTFPNRIFKEYSWTPSQSGQYYVYFWHYDKTGDADLNISWEKTGQAQSDSAPAGFTSVKSAKGVNLYESVNKSDYVQVVDLSQGASIELLTGQQIGNTSETPAYGGISPTFERQSLGDAWGQFQSRYSNAFSITNGAFFQGAPDPAGLSYPLRTGNMGNPDLPGPVSAIVFDGFAAKTVDTDKQLKLNIWNNSASISAFDPNNPYSLFQTTAAPKQIVGLTGDANKDGAGNSSRPRTYIGVQDRDSNGTNETVLILNSTGATEGKAAQILKDFGANQVMMLDGGGSTQMSAQGQSYISSERKIPQTIGVVSG